MSDEADIANEHVELSRLAAIEACRHSPGLVAKGFCWFCDEPVPPAYKFCDRDCAEDYEAEEAALIRSGKLKGSDSYVD
jgi:hypothetical protein